MEVTLSPEMAALLAAELEAGIYPSPEAMVDEALRSFFGRESNYGDWLRREAAVGLEDSRAGRFKEVDPREYFADLRARLAERTRR